MHLLLLNWEKKAVLNQSISKKQYNVYKKRHIPWRFLYIYSYFVFVCIYGRFLCQNQNIPYRDTLVLHCNIAEACLLFCTEYCWHLAHETCHYKLTIKILDNKITVNKVVAVILLVTYYTM